MLGGLVFVYVVSRISTFLIKQWSNFSLTT
jgi:hypothetical protein